MNGTTACGKNPLQAHHPHPFPPLGATNGVCGIQAGAPPKGAMIGGINIDGCECIGTLGGIGTT